jgi:hypothetical protein
MALRDELPCVIFSVRKVHTALWAGYLERRYINISIVLYHCIEQMVSHQRLPGQLHAYKFMINMSLDLVSIFSSTSEQTRGSFFPLLGQNPTPENHAKLHFTIGIPSILIKISLVHMCSYLVPFSCGTKSQLSVSFSLDLKTVSISQCNLFTWILCLIWWNLQVLDR